MQGSSTNYKMRNGSPKAFAGSSKILVRDATVQDTPMLHEYSLRLARETEDTILDDEILRQGLEALLTDRSKGRYFVAEEDAGDTGDVRGRIVGCLSVTYEWSDWRNGTIWWLQNVYVEQTYRKRGVFRALFDSVMTIVRNDPSVKGLRLLANKSNVVAHKTYESLGMDGEHYKEYEIMK